MARRYPEYKELNLVTIHQRILENWKQNKIFEKSVSSREHGESFVFYEGPPSANGMPGIHHVMVRTIKDVFCRYKTLQGYQVKRKAGWDTHGLPVELGVEKELGITKEKIGKKISIEEYNNACRNAVMRYTNVWNHLTEKMGYWMDIDNAYITCKTKYIESVWWLLKQLWDKSLLYKSHTIQPYSPKAGTGLSSHELNMPGCYRNIKDISVIAQFPAIQNEPFKKVFGNAVKEGDKIYFLAWTTTPWTLPSNTALTVGEEIEYVVVESFNAYTQGRQKVVLAKNLLGKYFKEELRDQPLNGYNGKGKSIPWQIIWEGTGKYLLELRYEQLLPYVLPYRNVDKAFRIVPGDFVTTEDGTGIVHTAPTFGADDAKVAKETGVPFMLVLDDNDNPVPLVDLQGRFTKHMGDLAGKYVKSEYYPEGEAPEKSVDIEIAIKLKEENKAFKVEKYEHTYPHCWRTDKPILYYPLDSWFIRVTAEKEKLVALNKGINWKPKATGEGRFANWLENVNDWNLSRSRFWGIPLPIWSTEDGTESKIFGSVEELKQACDEAVKVGLIDNHPFESFEPGNMSDKNYDSIDLHRHVVDKLILFSNSGKPMHREVDLIDVWFDSGAMPYAQLHYPFENKHSFKKSYPANFIAEGIDQTRGWFYTLHVIATLVFDSVAYRNVIASGLVLDKNGQKMSKHLGNVVDPFETLSKYGADAVRWYMVSSTQPWGNLKFDLEEVTKIQHKFFSTLYNVYGFFALYANIDHFEWKEEEQTQVNSRTELDRYILSRLEMIKQTVQSNLDNYEPARATWAISDFVTEELSNWYVRLCRRRFWKEDMSENKQMAYETLYQCLLTVSKLMSPIAPFFADWLYKNLNGKEKSVHLTYLLPVKEELIDKRLNDRMALAQKIVYITFSLRKKQKIKVRQPLQKIMIPVLTPEIEELVKSIRSIILSETNIKELEVIGDVSGILIKKIKPDFKKLGTKYGKKMKQITRAISKMKQRDIQKLEKEGKLLLSLDKEKISIILEDVEIIVEDIPGWLVMTKAGVTVALDITISSELRYEGISRELVNRIQNLRKNSGLEVTDRIKLEILESDEIREAVSRNKSYITSETLANELHIVGEMTESKKFEFDNIQTSIHFVKA